ncbi:hypothetical protein PROFUN_14525 [Planoprotostelium fungivorum]|uniref:DUF547 domain-containing protein n=1 Tax=Planoprotostelium fungivorum TaxID=1890364 RepID=A0A2P6N6K8_9EUKA|nr:hypothetical protein PROFUN_14525 [Planoprotostelium fungivorum]
MEGDDKSPPEDDREHPGGSTKSESLLEKARQVSFSQRLVFSWRGRRGNVQKRAVAFGDVDNDDAKDPELVVGTTEGHLTIFKGSLKAPWRIASKLGTISCLAIGKIHPNSDKNSLIVIANEGYAFIFDNMTPLNKGSATSLAHRNAGKLSGPLRLSTSSLTGSSPPAGTQGIPVNAANPSFIAPSIISRVPINITSILIDDIDGDGENEIVMGTNDGEVHIFNLRGMETVQSPSPMLSQQEPSSTFQKVVQCLSIITEIIKKFSGGRIHTEEEQLLLTINRSQEFKEFGLSVKELQNASLDAVRNEEILPFLVNLHNLLMIHATILFSGQRESRVNFLKRAVYNIGGESTAPPPLIKTGREFSLLELDSLFIRGNSTSTPNLYGYGGPQGPKLKTDDPRGRFVNTRVEPRINFTLNLATKSSPSIRIYHTSTWQMQMEEATREYLRERVVIDSTRKTNRGEAITWALRYLRAETTDQYREDYNLNYEPFSWDFCFHMALPMNRQVSAPQIMTTSHNTLNPNTPTNMTSSPQNTNSSYGNSLKNLLGLTQKKEEEPPIPDARRSSVNLSSKSNNSVSFDSKSSRSSLKGPPIEIENAKERSTLGHSAQQNVSAPTRELNLKMKRSFHLDGEVVYMLSRRDHDGKILQLGLFDKQGQNRIGTIRHHDQVQLCPYQLLGSTKKNQTEGKIIDVVNVSHQPDRPARSITCYDDGHLRLTENDRTLWEVRVDAEVLGVGMVKEKTSEEHIVTVGWEGTTFIIDQEGNMVYHEMEDKITTFGPTSAIAYITGTDEIILYYGICSSLMSMKTTNVKNLLREEMQGRDLLKKNPHSEWSHEELASLYYTAINYEKPEGIDKYRKELLDKIEKSTGEVKKLEAKLMKTRHG